MHEQWLSRELSFNLNSRRTPLSASQFIHNATSNVDFVRRLSLTGSLAGHDEAVHALSWSSDGRFLVTGSEDCKAKVWDAARCKAVSSFDTGHTSTIFCAKFMPGTSNEQIITASADKQVRVINLQRAAAKPYHSHRGRVRSVAPVTPFEFLSAGEDGTVRQFDSRDTPPSSRAQDWNGSYDRRSVLVDQKSEPGGKVAIYCLAMDPLRPHILATGGSDAIVRVFDRRYIPAVPVRSRAQWAYCLVPDHLVRATRTTMFAGLPVTISRLHHITGVSFSHTGQQLVASYAGEHIYSFDTTEHAQDYEAIASSVQDRYIRTSFPTSQRRSAVFASPTPPPAGPHPANRITAAALQRRAVTRGGQDTRHSRPANGDNNASLADHVQPANSSNSAAPSQLTGGPPSPPPRPLPQNNGLPNGNPGAAHATGTRPRRHVTFMAITPHAVYSQSMPMPHSADAPERNAAAQPDGVEPSASAPPPAAGGGASAASDPPHSRPAATFITRSGTPHVVMRLSGPSVFPRRTPAAPIPPSTAPPTGSTLGAVTEQTMFPGRPNTNTQGTVTERPPGRNLPLSHRMLVLSSARRGDARPAAANERQGAARGMSRPPLPSSIAALAAAAAALEDSLSPFTFPPPPRPQTASRNDTASSSLPSRRSTSPAPRNTLAPGSSAEQGVTGPRPDATSRQPEGNGQATQEGAGTGAESEHARKRRRLSLFPPRFTSPPPSPGAPSAPPHPSTTPPSNPSRRATRNTGSAPSSNTSRAASALLPSRQNVLSMFQSWAAMSQRYLGLNRSTPATPTSTSRRTAPDLDLPHPSSGSQHQDPSTVNPAQETASREGIVAVQTSRDHAEASSAPTSITQVPAADARSEEALPHTDIPAEAPLEIPEAASDVGNGGTAVARQLPSSRSLHVPVDDSSGLEPPKTKRSRVERAGGFKGERNDSGSDSEPEMPARIPRRRPSLFSRVLDDHPGSPEPALPQAMPEPVCGMELDSHSPAAEAPAYGLAATCGEQVRERASGAAPRFGPVDAVADASLSLRGHLVATNPSSPGPNADVNDDTDSTHAFTTASLERDGQEQVSGFKPRRDIPPAARLIPGISAVRTIPRYPTPSLTVTATPRDPSLIGRCDLSSALSPTSSSVQRVTHTSLPVSPTSQHANYSSQLPSANTGEEPTSLHHTNPQHSIPLASTRPDQAGERERDGLHRPGTAVPTADMSAQYQVPSARHRAHGLAGQPGLSSDDIASREAVPPGKRPRHEPEPHVTSSLSLTSAPPTPTPHSKKKQAVPPTQGRNLVALRRSAPAPGTAPDSSVTAGATTDADLHPVVLATLQRWSDHWDPTPAHSGSPVNVPESGLTSPSRWPPSPGRSAFSLVHSPRHMQHLMLEDGSQQEMGAARSQVGAGAEPAAVGAPAADGSVVTEAGSPPQASTSKAATKILSPSFKPPLPAPPTAKPSSPPRPTQHPNTMHTPQPAPAHATVIASPSSPTALCADASSYPRNPPLAPPNSSSHPAFNVPHSAADEYGPFERFLFSPPPSALHRTRLVAGAGLTAGRDGVHETRAPAITHNRHSDAIAARRRVEISQSFHRGQAHHSEGRLLSASTALGSTSQASQEPGQGQGHQVGGGSSGQREGQPSQHVRTPGRPRRRPSRTHVIIRVSTSFHPGGDGSDDDDDDMDGPGMPDLSSPLLSGPFFQPYMESEFHATLPFTFGAGDPEEGGDVFVGGVGVPVGGNQRREGFNRGERADGGAAEDGQGSAPPGRRDAASQAGEEDGLMGRDIAGGEGAMGAGRSRNEGAMDLDEQLSMPRRQRARDARLNAILGRIRAEIGSASMDDDEHTQPVTAAIRADQGAAHSTDRAGQQGSHPAGPDSAAGIPAEGDGPAEGPLADGRSRAQAVWRHGVMTGGAGLQAAVGSGVDEHNGRAGGAMGRGDRQGPEGERGGWRVGEGWRAASERWRSVSPWRAASREGAWAGGDGFRTGEARENPLSGTADLSRSGPSAPSSSTEQMQPGMADDASGIPAWHQAFLSDMGGGTQSHTSRRQNAASGSNRREGGAAQPAVHVSVASGDGNSIPRHDDGASGRPAAVDLYEYVDSEEERDAGVNVSLLRAMRGGASGAATAAAPVRRRLGADMEGGPRYPGFAPGFLTRRRGIRRAVGSRDAEQEGGEERAAASREELQARGSEVEREAEGWPPVWERDIWSYRSRARYSEREGLWQYRSRDRPDGVLGPIMAGDAERQGEEGRAALGYRHQRTGPVLEEEDVSEDEEGQPPESGHYQQRFTGHKNQRFTKEGYKMEVSYLGPSSDFIMSGSDTGKIFIWQAKTGRLINTLQTDDVVASCVQPHPQDLCFASSGHQPVVKLWHPVAEEPALFPLEQEGAPQPEEEANLPGLNTLLSVMQVLGHGMGEASLEGPLGPAPPPPRAGEERTTETRWTPPPREVGGECSIM